MNFFLADILISKDKDVDLNIKKQILIKGLDLINKELKTSKTNSSCLTVSLRFINIRDMKKLNHSFSGSNKETNVLSFSPDPNETDENNNVLTGTFEVLDPNTDTTPPVVTVPDNMTVSVSTLGTQTITFVASWFDEGGGVSMSCSTEHGVSASDFNRISNF